jgi:hypothetical protein
LSKNHHTELSSTITAAATESSYKPKKPREDMFSTGPVLTGYTVAVPSGKAHREWRTLNLKRIHDEDILLRKNKTCATMAVVCRFCIPSTLRIGG